MAQQTHSEVERIDRDTALKFCEDIIAARDVGQMASSYAAKAIEHDMEGKTLVVQLKYIAANVGSEYESRINDILNVDTSGFNRGYCQICGERDAHAHENGMVCVACFDDVGEPEECARCGDMGYDGMKLDVIKWAENHPKHTVADEAAKVDLNPITDAGEHVRICKGCRQHY